MKTEPPPDRRKFADDRDEAEYLYQKLLYWLYEREDPTRARAFAERLARLLSNVSPDHRAIFPEECRSLICEAKGDLPGAIKHRENEVQLMKRLHEISRNSPQREDLLRLHGYDDLSDRLDLLAALYHDSGQLDRAIEALQESKRLCAQHRIAFDGGELLRECLEEKRNTGGRLRDSRDGHAKFHRGNGGVQSRSKASKLG
jgi:tetratricopeptide (TPR) repeat protein